MQRVTVPSDGIPPIARETGIGEETAGLAVRRWRWQVEEAAE